MTTTLSKSPTLPAAPARLRPRDALLVALEVLTATAGAWLVRLPGGAKKCWLAYSVVKEVQPDRPIPPGCRMFSVPVWKYAQIREALSEN